MHFYRQHREDFNEGPRRWAPLKGLQWPSIAQLVPTRLAGQGSSLSTPQHRSADQGGEIRPDGLIASS